LQIANELLMTEKHYVDILDLLVKVRALPTAQPPPSLHRARCVLTPTHARHTSSPLRQVFLQPLREGDLLPPESILAIFGNTETLRYPFFGLRIMACHRMGRLTRPAGRDKHVLFHELLHKRVRDWMTFQQFGVGDIFYDHVRVEAPSPPPGGSTRRS
jgi:hypothetical protein